MGTRIQDVVSVSITRETAKLALTGFGTPLILGETSRIYERTKTYTTLDEMVADGFATTDELYKAANALMSQDTSPDQFKIGRKYANVNAKQTFAITGTASAGHFHLTLGAETTAVIAYDANAAAVKAALEALTAVTEVTVTGTLADGFVIEFTGTDANKHFATMTVDITALTGATTGTVTVNQYGSATETWTDALSNIRAADDNWYGLVAITRTKADILLIAAAIEPLLKIYVACSKDADILTSVTTDLASVLQDATYDRTALLWSDDEANYPDAAWMGLQLPKDPGSSNWRGKTLTGITPDDLSTSEITYLDAKNCNYYETIGGVNVTFGEGCMVSGERIDIMHGCDWLQTRIAERIFLRLIVSEKIPFTTQGIAVIENEIRYQLGKAVDVGLIVAGSQIVTTPDITAVDPLEKTARWLNGITFSAQLAGAVNKVSISGKLSV